MLASAAALMLCNAGAGQGQATPRTEPNAPGAGFQFSDAPGFAIAGVTDWTAAGGHGSDATLRTSEDLNRETFALATPASMPAETAASREEENRLRRALAAGPDAYAANHALGMYYLRAAQFVQATQPLSAALKLRPNDAASAYALALAYRGTGDAARARQMVQEALKRGETADLLRLEGELEEALGDPVRAVQEEERAARLEPGEENYLAWGSELLLHRAIWQASQVLASGTAAHPGSARLHTAWGASLFSEAKYEESARRLCEAVALDPAAREPYVFLGKAAIASPVPLPCAREMLEQFARLRPDDAEASYYLAMALLKQASPPEPQRAEALLRHAVMVNPKDAEAYLQLGVMALSRRTYTEAIAFLMEAVKSNPQMGEAHFRLGVIYDRLGDPAKARQEYHLHEEADAANAARVEQHRREVKQFLITSSGQQVHGAAP